MDSTTAKVYKEVYEKLDAKEVEKDIYRIARISEKDQRLMYCEVCQR